MSNVIFPGGITALVGETTRTLQFEVQNVDGVNDLSSDGHVYVGQLYKNSATSSVHAVVSATKTSNDIIGNAAYAVASVLPVAAGSVPESVVLTEVGAVARVKVLPAVVGTALVGVVNYVPFNPATPDTTGGISGSGVEIGTVMNHKAGDNYADVLLHV